MTITAGVLAVIAFVALMFFSSGSRARVLLGALCGGAIGGIFTVIGLAVFGALTRVGDALLSVF